MIVIDASALLEVLLQGPSAQPILAIMQATGETLHAPHLIDIEIAHVLRRASASGEIEAGRGSAALALLADLRMDRYPHEALLPRIWALRHNLSAYDAAYVALAEALDAELLTRDKRLAAAVGHRARIAVI